ncbi:hypothetical protein LCGC14_1083850 [marine sediment metagenome]|uniref:Uncharacterized protein n=1 Tax=marine sediment metagenome TaxID=412755 RepID=A0A0F9MIY6_9ZZZZ
MKVRFLFYKAKFEWRSFLKTRKIHLIDDAINVWTLLINLPGVVWQERSWNVKKWGKAVWQFIKECYSHVEVWLPDEYGRFYDEAESLGHFPVHAYFGTCYTSTMRDDEKGTCSRPASEVIKHPERWEYKEFDITPWQYHIGLVWMQKQVKLNKGYGFKNYGRFFGLGKIIYDRWKNICSQFTHNYAVMVFIFSMPFKIVSPRRLSRLLPGKMQRLIDA